MQKNEQNKIRMVHLVWSIVPHLFPLSVTLKKQVGYFNHLGVVALVAIMSGFWEVSFGIRDVIALGNQRGSCSGRLTTTILLIVITTMDVSELLLALKAWKFLTTTLKCICKGSLTDVQSGVRWAEQGCLHTSPHLLFWLPYPIIVSNTKVKLW